MIYFITVNYYSTELIKQLLISIEFAKENYKLIIVNNSVDDDSIQQIYQINSKATILTPEVNLGFGAGCNLGIQYVYNHNPQGIIWLINPDTQLNEDAICYVKKCLKQTPSLAILGTKIKDLQGNIWFSQGTFNPWTGSIKDKAKGQIVSDSSVNTQDCRWVSGCSLILNLKQFKSCPSFDAHYFLYYEDTDLCERYYQQGYHIAVTQSVLVTHLVSSINGRNPYTQFQHATYSKLYFLQQHGTALALALNLLYMLMLVVLIFPKNRSAALGRWQGLKTFMISQTKS